MLNNLIRERREKNRMVEIKDSPLPASLTLQAVSTFCILPVLTSSIWKSRKSLEKIKEERNVCHFYFEFPGAFFFPLPLHSYSNSEFFHFRKFPCIIRVNPIKNFHSAYYLYVFGGKILKINIFYNFCLFFELMSCKKKMWIWPIKYIPANLTTLFFQFWKFEKKRIFLKIMVGS